MPDGLKRRMKEVARDFRKAPTATEAVLWEAIRYQALGRKFRRQQPIGPFVVDCYCSVERLVVEVDGGVHESPVERDRDRQECLEALGLRFLRIPADHVLTDLPRVLRDVHRCFQHPSPLVGEGQGEGGRRRRPTQPHRTDHGAGAAGPLRQQEAHA